MYNNNTIYTNIQFVTGGDKDAPSNGTARMTITDTGEVGIGMSGPSVELDVTGDIEYTGTISDVSLREIKENIVEISGSGMIDKFKKIPLYNYNLKPEYCGANVTRENDRYIKNSRKYGLIADDEVLYEEFPEIVQWKVVSGSESTIHAIDTTSYIGMLHGVVKELVTKVEALEAQVSGSS